MDNFINLAKQGYQAYENSQGSHNQEGGDVQDRRYHESPTVPQFNHEEVISQANEHAGDSGHHSFFSSAMSHLSGQHTSEHSQPIDEQHLINIHQQAYEHGKGSSLDASSMGAAAAMQAFKLYTSGQSSSSGSSSGLMSLAMGEAVKLFESSGGPSSGGKQQVINGAAMTMMKFVVQSKFGGGGGGSGSLGGIMALANKIV